MRRYITEFIGTFFLVLVVALTGNAAAIGVTLMAMVFAGGHISGAAPVSTRTNCPPLHQERELQ